MAGSPKDNEEKLNAILNAWKTLAADKAFAGMTAAQFETAIAPSFTTRQQLDGVEDQRTHLINSRNDAYDASLAKAAAVVAGVLSDPTFGPYKSPFHPMRVTQNSKRNALLHRRRPTAPPTD